MNKKLTFTISGPAGSVEGALATDVAKALEGLSEAVRLLVQDLGNRFKGVGHPPRWLSDQSALRLVAMRPGSAVLDVAIDAPPGAQPYLEGFGDQALDSLSRWDGEEDSTLPREVADVLYATAGKLSEGAGLWLGDEASPHRVEVRRKSVAVRSRRDVTEGLLQGWLREVNWHKRTAQLHDYEGGYVQLRFGPDLADDMLRLATQHVEVRGSGRFNAKGEWASVDVRELTATRSWREPFDVESFLDDPNAKVFDAEQMVIASEPFDVDEFIQFIHEGRDAGE